MFVPPAVGLLPALLTPCFNPGCVFQPISLVYGVHAVPQGKLMVRPDDLTIQAVYFGRGSTQQAFRDRHHWLRRHPGGPRGQQQHHQ